MNNKSKFSVMALVLLSIAALASCTPTTTSTTTSAAASTVPDYGTVNLGLQGNFGASAGFVGVAEGLFKAQGVNAVTQIQTGPNIITGLKSGTIDIGFLGNGVAWNYFLKTAAPIKMLCIDNLSNDDRLIASKTGKGAALSEASSNADVYAALKGATVALNYGATPGTFFQSLVDVLDEGKAAGEQIWYKVPGTSDEYPTTSTHDAAYEITLQSMENSAVTAAMVSASAPDFCVAFSPVSTALVTLGNKVVATTLGRLGDKKLAPSTWAVSTTFLAAHPDAVKAFTRGLMASFDFRHNNLSKASDDTANANKFDGSYDTSIAYWPSAADMKGYYSTATGKGMQYVDQIRATQVSKSQLAEGALESKDVVIDFQWIVDACNAVAA